MFLNKEDFGNSIIYNQICILKFFFLLFLFGYVSCVCSFVLFDCLCVSFCYIEDNVWFKCGGVDRSIFMRFKWFVFVYLRYVFLVILVFYVSFVCFQVLRVKYVKWCILVYFGVVWGVKWIAYTWSQVDGRNWRLKEVLCIRNLYQDILFQIVFQLFQSSYMYSL